MPACRGSSILTGMARWHPAASVSLDLLPWHHLSATPVVTYGLSGPPAGAVDMGRGGGVKERTALWERPWKQFEALLLSRESRARGSGFLAGMWLVDPWGEGPCSDVVSQ